jgi:hypothetical protein
MMPPDPILPVQQPFVYASQGQFLQPSRATPNSGRVAFTWGAIFGPVLVAVFFVLAILLPSFILGVYVFYLVLGLLSILAQVICYFTAALLASRRTGKTITGVLTNLWITLWYLLSFIPLYFLQKNALMRAMLLSSSGYTTVFFLFAGIFLLVSLILGSGLGAIGGVIGKEQSQQKPATSLF